MPNNPGVMFMNLLEMSVDAVRFAGADVSYHLLEAAASLVGEVEMSRQVANTAQFISTNAVCRNYMSIAHADHGPDDFMALALRVAREYIDIETTKQQLNKQASDEIASPFTVEELLIEEGERSARDAAWREAKKEWSFARYKEFRGR